MAAVKKVVCPKCGAKLKFDPDKITSEVVKFKCPGCKTVIRIKKPGTDQKFSSTQIPGSSKPSEDTIIQEREATNLAQPEKPVPAEKQIPEAAEAALNPRNRSSKNINMTSWRSMKKERPGQTIMNGHGTPKKKRPKFLKQLSIWILFRSLSRTCMKPLPTCSRQRCTTSREKPTWKKTC